MRFLLVTKCIVIAVTVLSLYCYTYSLWGNVKEVVQAAEGELDKRPRPELDAYNVKLVLGKTPWWACWTLLTTGLVETHILPYIIFVVVVCTGGQYCEKLWLTKSYARFVVIMLASTTFIEALIWTCIGSKPATICGANGLLAGIVVALRQMIPGHTIILFRNRVRVQLRWLPLSFLILVSALQILGLEDNVFAYYLGFVGGWYYLRYHHVTSGIGVGDASDAFSFANFFPTTFASWMEPALDKIYYVLSTRLHLVKQFTTEDIDESNQRYTARLSGTLLPTHSRGARITNERRKMMLRAMDKGM